MTKRAIAVVVVAMALGCGASEGAGDATDASVSAPTMEAKGGCSPACGSCQACDSLTNTCVPCGSQACGSLTGAAGLTYGILLKASACVGGACSVTSSTNCHNMRCNAPVGCGAVGFDCLGASNCASFASCSPSHVCFSQSAGSICSSDPQCDSSLGLSCSGGFCCKGPCAAGKVCGYSGHEGSCIGDDGSACTAGSQCGSGICADGVCCKTSCRGQCQACNVAGKAGTCSPVIGKPLVGHSPCSGASTDPNCAQACDGVDGAKCNYAATSTSCGASTCTAGTATHVSTCDGAGNCGDKPASCGAYACDVTTCKTTCAGTSDCAAGYYCKGTTCTAAEGLGKACSGASGCTAPLTCTDGVCCASASCDVGSSCAIPGKEGTCQKNSGSACASDGECGTGHCADGVCCDTACNGQCEACDIPDSTSGRPGKCIPVKGKPHGTRAACTPDPSNPCAAGACDGSTTASCAAFAGSDTMCRAPTCKDGSFTTPSNCDGKGKCPDAITASCDGFACAPDGSACKTACATDDDCISGYACKTAKCTKKTAKCSDDGLSSISLDGTTKRCAPYRCNTDGTCAGSCATADDCAPGSSCGTDGKCASASAGGGGGTSSGGGCSVRSDGEASGVVGLAWLLVVAACMRRRAGL